MLEFRRGDTNPINVLVRRPQIDSGTGEQAVDARGVPLWDPVNLTNVTLTFTARDRKNAIIIQKDSLSAGITYQSPLTAGRATVIIAPADTEDLAAPLYLNYDLQMVEGDGTKTTVDKGQAVLREDVTRG